METQIETSEHRSAVSGNLPARPASADLRARGEALLHAINRPDLSSGQLLTPDVRLTVFDRGQIRESDGRREVRERLERIAGDAGIRFEPGGTRLADDAIFFWGGKSVESRPGWMIAMFFRHDRFFELRIYLLA